MGLVICKLNRVYSTERGDLGLTTLNGKEVKAVACCPIGSWVMCHVKEDGTAVAIGERSEIDETGDKIRTAVLSGVVVFKAGATTT